MLKRVIFGLTGINPECKWSGHNITYTTIDSSNANDGSYTTCGTTAGSGTTKDESYTTCTTSPGSHTTNESSYTTCDECTSCDKDCKKK